MFVIACYLVSKKSDDGLGIVWFFAAMLDWAFIEQIVRRITE